MQKKGYKLRVPDDLAALVKNMHPNLKKKIKASLKMIMADPDSGKTLKDEHSGLRSFRVSRFRIIYGTAGRAIEVIALGPRESVYEETVHLLRKEGVIK